MYVLQEAKEHTMLLEQHQISVIHLRGTQSKRVLWAYHPLLFHGVKLNSESRLNFNDFFLVYPVSYLPNLPNTNVKQQHRLKKVLMGSVSDFMN